MNDKEFLDAMEHIVSALMERGYDPYAQLTGYVTENEPTYITSYKGARQLILTPVSYTHLDVYKRQVLTHSASN